MTCDNVDASYETRWAKDGDTKQLTLQDYIRLKHKNSFPCDSADKDPSIMQETWVRSVGGEDPLEKGKAISSPVFWPGEFHGLYIVHGVAKSRTQLSDFHFTSLQSTMTGQTNICY